MAKKIVCIHLFNNYSGSPKVLMQVMNILITRGYDVDLITNKSEGFLSGLEGINYHYVSYKWKKNELLTLIYFIIAQIQLFCKVIKWYRNIDSIFYINTITPFGAAIACKLCKKSIIYHVHEKYIKSNLLHKICEYVYDKSNCYSIFVSKYLQESYLDKLTKSSVIYNSLEQTYKDVVAEFTKNRTIKPTTILMVCSLRRFKGIYEFITLSAMLPKCKFELVVNATETEVEHFKNENPLSSNLYIFGSQSNLHPFYQRAKLLLNLSDPNLWIETFGLTILEAMAYGIPSIVPNVGGPIELVTNESNGYLIHPKELNDIKQKIESLMEDDNLYNCFSKNAILKSNDFDINKMTSQIIRIIENIQYN